MNNEKGSKYGEEDVKLCSAEEADIRVSAGDRMKLQREIHSIENKWLPCCARGIHGGETDGTYQSRDKRETDPGSLGDD